MQGLPQQLHEIFAETNYLCVFVACLIPEVGSAKATKKVGTGQTLHRPWS